MLITTESYYNINYLIEDFNMRPLSKEKDVFKKAQRNKNVFWFLHYLHSGSITKCTTYIISSNDLIITYDAQSS